MVDVQFRYEPLAYLLKTGLPDLALECWENHTKENPFYAQPEFGPDWGNYQHQENNKDLGFIAMREEGKLVGYATVKIVKDIHQVEMQIAILLDVYITPAKRGYAIKLFRYVESLVMQMGAYRLDVSQPLTSRPEVAEFYRFMGMQPMELIWSKVLGKEGEA